MTTLTRLAAQRIAHQPPQAHRQNGQNSYDLVREAVGCMGGLGRTIGAGTLSTETLQALRTE